MKAKWGFYLTVIGAMLLCAGGQAATITVDTTSDDSSVDENCTLRDAVYSAMNDVAVDDCTAGSGTDNIVLAVTGTITLDATIPVISEGLTITGPGANALAVDAAGGGFRVFTIDSAGNNQTVTISGLTISGGNTAASGAGISVGAGDTLNLSACVVSNNTSSNTGGGIFNEGTLNLSNSEVKDNQVTGFDGGGIYNTGGTVNLDNQSSIHGNTAARYGGGVYSTPGSNIDATLNITDSAIGGAGSPNTAGSGGGIYSDVGATLIIKNSSVSGNNVTNWGGGIRNNGIADISNSSIGETGLPNTASNGGGIDNRGTLQLSNSQVVANTSTVNGGGLYNTAAATLTITDSAIGPGNEAVSGSGIYNNGATLTMAGSELTENTASSLGGGLSCAGVGEVSVETTTISGNRATNGGGISAQGDCILTLADSTITGNTTNADAGGIYVIGGSTVNVYRSTIGPDNEAIVGGGIATNGTLNINNSTISGNRSLASGAAGIYQYGGVAALFNVTITHNSTTNYTGGGFRIDNGVFELRNSIVAGNTDNSVTGHHDCSGTLAISMNNLIQDVTGCSGMDVSDITGQDPLLEALADNGGPTLTHALQSTSPAIDAGNDSTGCYDHNDVTLTTDQRGFSRPQDGNLDGTARCDIGAYEFAWPPDIAVTDSDAPADDLQISFPTTVNNAKSPAAIVTIHNQGQLPLTVSNIGFNGVGSGEFTYDLEAGDTPCHGLAIVLNPGLSCTLSIVFSPHWEGDKSAMLTITSDDPDEGTVNIALAGTGVTPPAATPPAESGGGGCSLRGGTHFDPLLPLMFILSILYLSVRRDITPT